MEVDEVIAFTSAGITTPKLYLGVNLYHKKVDYSKRFSIRSDRGVYKIWRYR